MVNFSKHKPLIGAHVSFLKNDQLYGAISDLIAINATSGAFYISNSRSYNNFDLNLNLIIKAQKLAANNNFDLKNLIVHAPLVGNLANIDPDSQTSELTFNSYLRDLKLLDQCGIILYNFHPGSAVNKQLGILKLATNINRLHQATPDSKTILLLETMLMKGNYLGGNFKELGQIIDLIENKSRIGICLDTCHVWDSGYDIKNHLDSVLAEFDQQIGLKYLKALHINDSKNQIGTNKDRHEAIGEGFIGLDALKLIVNHKKLRNLPKALETPYSKDNIIRWTKEINLLLN